jgi:hypothetical protein
MSWRERVVVTLCVRMAGYSFAELFGKRFMVLVRVSVLTVSVFFVVSVGLEHFGSLVPYGFAITASMDKYLFTQAGRVRFGKRVLAVTLL